MKNRIDKILAKLPENWSPPTEGKKYYILLTALLLASFLLGALWFFPVDSLKFRVARELARELNADVTIGGMEIVFPLQLQFSDVRAGLRSQPSHALRIDTLRVKPAWSALLLGKRAFTFSGRLNQGTAEGAVDADGNVTLNLRQVRFSLPVSETGSLVLAGMAGDVSLAGKYPMAADAESTVGLEIKNLELHGLQSLGLGPEVLPLGQLRLQGKGRGSVLQLERLDLAGGAIQSDAKGSIVFRQPMETSNLRLNATLKVDPQLREIGELLALSQKPAADGSYQFRLIGTFGRPLVR